MLQHACEADAGHALWTRSTPQALLTVIAGVLGAYEAQRGRATMQGQAAEFMTPQVIERMRLLQAEVSEKFM
jgi:hypothetical protein